MAIREYLWGDPQEVFTRLQNQIPISDYHIEFESPYNFDIELNKSVLEKEKQRLEEIKSKHKSSSKKYKKANKQLLEIYNILENNENRLLHFSIDQFSYEEWNNFIGYINLFKSIMDNIDEFKSKSPNAVNIATYIAKMVKCKNPELIIDKAIVKISNSKYIENITNKDLEILFKEIKHIDKNGDIFKEFREYKKWNWKIKKKLSNSNIQYLNYLAKMLIDIQVIFLFNKIKFTEIIEIITAILLYNDAPVKKNLLNLEKTIMIVTGVGKDLTYSYEGKSVSMKDGNTPFVEIS